MSTSPLDGVAIGKRIVRARKESGGMTGRQLAEALDVSERSLRDYESGATIPWRHFTRLEQLTGRSTEWFLHGRVKRDIAERRHEQLMEGLRNISRDLERLGSELRDIKVDQSRAARGTGSRSR